MLEGVDLVQERAGCFVLQRRAAGQVAQGVHVRQPGLHAPLHDGRDLFGLVEGGDGERHAVRRLVGERRAAFVAKAAPHVIGRTKPARFGTGPLEPGGAHGHQRQEKIAARLLAHAAMAHRRLAERALDAKAHRAALAAAGIDRLVVEAHRGPPPRLNAALTASPPRW
jgi:hypothetical protein